MFYAIGVPRHFLFKSETTQKMLCDTGGRFARVETTDTTMPMCMAFIKACNKFQ